MGGLTAERDLISLASYYLEAEVPYKAAKVLDKGINKDKNIDPTAKNLELLANAWRFAAEYKKSLVEMERAAQKSEEGNLLHTLATLYNANDRYKDAVRVGKEALRKGKLKRVDQVHLVIGNAYLEMGEFDSAVKSFKDAAKDERSAKIANQWARYAERDRPVCSTPTTNWAWNAARSRRWPITAMRPATSAPAWPAAASTRRRWSSRRVR
jgi:tetratricopeptide (TPR) repeat protein